MRIKAGLIVWAVMLVIACGPNRLAEAQQQQRATSEQRQVRVYFPRDGNPHPRDPFNLQFVVRMVATAAPARPTLLALLAGPTAEEKRRRLRPLDSGGLAISALKINDGTARVDFVSRGGKRWAGDLSPAEFRQAVDRTLKQFSTVRRVVISVDGKTDFDSQR
ncbi:MAG TPA: GerMN domain-containing protein [Pyrinomonadaceae bacterium]|jgi:hypothetical protein|nr:GerMN domain-containing protein [Pyrinomonadaceae bacterium]